MRVNVGGFNLIPRNLTTPTPHPALVF